MTRQAIRPIRRAEDRLIDGVLLVDKPAGVTSHDVVDTVRRATGTRRIGHAGTLDPFATGLLVLLVGNATRLLAHLNGEPKVYHATIALGDETDTDDETGTVTRTAPPPAADRVRAAIASLTGEIDQVPPSYSAKQVSGQRAYKAARRGDALDLPPVRVTVHRWDVQSISDRRVEAVITCGGGTYIRALARDLGRLSGSAAHLSALRRTSSGTFDVRDAVTLDAIRGGHVAVRPPVEAVPHLEKVALDAGNVTNVRHGRAVPAVADGAHAAALVDDAGALVAVAERVESTWQPRVVLPNE